MIRFLRERKTVELLGEKSLRDNLIISLLAVTDRHFCAKVGVQLKLKFNGTPKSGSGRAASPLPRRAKSRRRRSVSTDWRAASRRSGDRRATKERMPPFPPANPSSATTRRSDSHRIAQRKQKTRRQRMTSKTQTAVSGPRRTPLRPSQRGVHACGETENPASGRRQAAGGRWVSAGMSGSLSLLR